VALGYALTAVCMQQMKRDIDLIELLCLWYQVESQWTPVEGYPVECPSTKGWRASRQYDSENDAAETDARGKLAKHVGAIVASIDEPYRSALYQVARNKVSGAVVWRSARLPEDKDEAAAITVEALDIFGSLL
jgi:hypothetical protein